MTTIEIARELGVSLAESEEFQKVLLARHRVAEDDALTELIRSFHQKRQDVYDLMQSPDMDKEDAIAATVDMERLQQQLYENPLFSGLMTAEQEFQNLVASVNREINACIGSDQTDPGCTGDCSGCAGCAH